MKNQAMLVLVKVHIELEWPVPGVLLSQTQEWEWQRVADKII